mmetsp:Transcript_299/g.594  ORF Transcript_299/g.594 Transcript_299/m.594 type:complete len:108 (+) Transcript_299:154-477(+)
MFWRPNPNLKLLSLHEYVEAGTSNVDLCRIKSKQNDSMLQEGSSSGKQNVPAFGRTYLKVLRCFAKNCSSRTKFAAIVSLILGSSKCECRTATIARTSEGAELQIVV